MNRTKNILKTFVCVLLLWASLVQAFTDVLVEAAHAVANGSATPEQEVLILTHYESFNLMGLGGAKRQGISDEVYQENQKFFVRFNNDVSHESLNKMGMVGNVPPVKKYYKPGTDTDINVSFQDKRDLRVKDIKVMRDSYNVAYGNKMKERYPTVQIDENINWSAKNETDFMPDIGHIDTEEFARTAKYVNKEGGLMYTNPKAVEVEIFKGESGYKIDLKGAEAYSTEMVENIEKKNQKFLKHSDKLHKISTLQKQIKNPEAKRILEMEMNKYKARCQLDQSHMAKYMDRLDDLNTKLRKQHGLPDPPKSEGIHILANDVSENRGANTIETAKTLYENRTAIQQKSTQNLSETYSEIATQQSDPKKRSEYIKKAAEMSNKHLTPGQQKQTIQAIEKKYGKNSSLVKELKLETQRAKYDQEMKSIVKLQKVEAVAGNINSAFGLYDKAVGMYDNYKKGGVWLVIKNQSEDYLKGKVDELKENVKERLFGKFQKNLTDRAMAAFPLLGPASALYGTYNTAYDTTRNIMTHVKIGGKTLDEHTQEGIDNNLYVSAADKQTRDANLTKMLTRLLENKKFSLPKGMTLLQAQKLVLANADRGGAMFAFLDGIPEPPEEIAKKNKLREARMAAHQKWKDDINPARPYQLISFRDQAYTLNRDLLELTTQVVFSTEGRRPQGGMALYRDGELVETQPAKVETGRYTFESEPDPMNKEKTLFYVSVTLEDRFKGMHDQLRAPTSYFYHMVWCEFDEQGKPLKKLGQTEQEVTVAVFPRGPNLTGSELLLCGENGQSLNDDARSQKLQAHLAGHFMALGVDPEPSRRMADVELYRVTLPAMLYSTYQTENDGGFSIYFFSQGTRLGKRRFSADGKLIGQEFGKQGLVLDIGSEKEKTGTESWYDEQGRKHGAQRIFLDGKVFTDEFYIHGKKHGRQVKIKPQNGHMQSIETYQDGKKHGPFEYYDSVDGVIRLKTVYQDDAEIGPHEEFYKNGNKTLYAEYAIENGEIVNHGRQQKWNEQGKLFSDEQYVSGELDGKCMYYTENGDVLRETSYSEGIKQGEERIYYDNSNLKSVTPFDGGKEHGTAVYYQQAGKKTLELLYVNGKKIGALKQWEAKNHSSEDYSGPNRLTYEAQYNATGDRVSSVSIQFPTGKPETKWEQHWTSVNGKSVKHGLERRYVGSKMILEYHWDRGKRDGQFKTWYDNGQAKELKEYKQGILHGKNNTWDSYGNILLSETQQDGLVIGERIELGKNSYKAPMYRNTFHEIKEGKSVSVPERLLWQEVKLVDGKYISHGQTRKKVNGRIVSVGTIVDGQQAGKVVGARDDGSKETKRLVDGKLDGASDDQARKTGTWRKWNEAGELQQEQTYKAGQLESPSQSTIEQSKPGQAIVSDSKKPRQVASVSLDGKTRRVVGYDADGNKSREGVYRETSGKLHKTIYSYKTVDGKSKYHGATERYVDNQLQSEDLYDQGVKISSTDCYEQDGKRYMTWTPYTQIDGKSVRHGIAKRYLDGKLIEEIEYQNGKEVK